MKKRFFARHRIIPGRLIDYGFKTENDRLAYSRALPDDGMKIIVEYDGAINGRMANRAALYNRQLEQTIGYEAEGKVMVISPSDIYGLGALSKDREAFVEAI